MWIRVIFTSLLISSIAPAVYAQSAEEKRAEQETEISGLRLVAASPSSEARGMRFGYVEQDTNPGGGRYSCSALSASQAESAARAVENALAALPKSAWSAIDLRYVLLCADTKAEGRPIGGIPVPPLRLLMLATGKDVASSPRLPYTALHELYHLIEMQKKTYQDTAWNNRFSGYDNSYGSESGNTGLGSGGAGFVNGYGRSFAHEERAELFAVHLLSGDMLSSHIVRTKDKQLVRKKLELMKKCATMLGNGACGM